MSDNSSILFLGIATAVLLCGAAVGIAIACSDNGMSAEEKNYYAGYDAGYAAALKEIADAERDSGMVRLTSIEKAEAPEKLLRQLEDESDNDFDVAYVYGEAKAYMPYYTAYEYGYNDGYYDAYNQDDKYGRNYQNYVDYMEEYYAQNSMANVKKAYSTPVAEAAPVATC